jgi:L-threonylcarbamoyladenylate synthase
VSGRRTEVLPVNPVTPEPAAIARAAAVLRAGGLVAFPTETVYGLGANALDAAAVARIFAAKGRPASNPLIVHLADAADLPRVAGTPNAVAARLAARFWPGPLTLVLPRAAGVPDAVTAGGPTVAVRVPSHPVARALIAAAGVPVAAPSANRSTRLSPTTAEHVLADLDGLVDLVLDGGPTPGGIESTVIDVTGDVPRLLRPGPVGPSALADAVGALARGSVGDGPARSPGMLEKHYSPRTPLRLVPRGAPTPPGRVGRLALGGASAGAVVAMPVEPAEYAARLYAELHRLDALGLELIVVEEPPDTDEWLAVRDRLRRAASM